MKNNKLARKFESHFASHGVEVELTLCHASGNGERVIYDIRLKKGTRAARVLSRAADIRTALGLPVFQPFWHGDSIRLAVSTRPLTENSLMKMLQSPDFRLSKMWLPIALGYDLMGAMQFADLAKFPHLLCGGATNSGKTVALQSLILSLAFIHPAQRVNLIIVDTGATGLEHFSHLPHLSHPIVRDVKTALHVLFALVNEMDRRVPLSVAEKRQLPAIICVIDEYLSLISDVKVAGDKEALTALLSSLLRRGRHAKIHVVLATQESAKQDMGINLNNLSARMAFACSNFYASRSILGEGGAEYLPGAGAMLFRGPESPKPTYIQGAYISSAETEALVARIASASHDFSNKFEINEQETLAAPPLALSPSSWGALSLPQPKVDHKEKMLADIVMWALGRDNISSRQMQEQFQFGAPKANPLLDDLTRMGIASAKFSKQPRTVLPQCVEDLLPEVLELLERHGHTVDHIQTAFDGRD